METMNYPNNTLLVASVAGIGMFLSTLDSGIINVALPYLKAYFHASYTTTAWTITLYFLILSSTIIIFGKLSDQFGRVRLFSLGLIVFGVSSFLCGTATNIYFLIALRGIQGIGAAMLQATSAALITTLIPPDKRGMALGNLGMIIGLGPILGPTITGLSISLLDWRWVFWLNIPICVIGLLCASKLADVKLDKKWSIDFFGISLIAIFLFSVICQITFIDYLSTQKVLLYSLTFIIGISFLSFIVVELSVKKPAINLKLFLNPSFSLILLGTIAFGLATAIILVAPPIILNHITLLKPWQIGLISFSAPLGIVLAARYSGKKMHSTGVLKLMLFGLLMMTIALLLLGYVQLKIFTLILLLFLYGLGGGLFQPSNIAATMKVVTSSEQGTIGSLNRMIHNFGNAIGAAISALFIQNQIKNGHIMLGVENSWNFAALIIMIALIGISFLCVSKSYQLTNSTIVD